MTHRQGPQGLVDLKSQVKPVVSKLGCRERSRVCKACVDASSSGMISLPVGWG